jgi:hypothetical protein
VTSSGVALPLPEDAPNACCSSLHHSIRNNGCMITHFSPSGLLSVATAVCAGVAAFYWFQSSRADLGEEFQIAASVDDNPALHIISAQADIETLRSGMRQSARLNKIAAIWSGLAAIFTALTSLAVALSV